MILPFGLIFAGIGALTCLRRNRSPAMATPKYHPGIPILMGVWFSALTLLSATAFVKLPQIRPIASEYSIFWVDRSGNFVGAKRSVFGVLESEIPEAVGTTVIWKKRAATRTFGMPFPVRGGGPAANGKIWGLCALGIFLIDPEGRNVEWLLRRDGEIFFGALCNKRGDHILACSTKVSKTVSMVVYALSVDEGVVGRFRLPSLRGRFSFIDNNHAVGIWGTRQLTITFNDHGKATMHSENTRRETRGFIGFIGNEPLFFEPGAEEAGEGGSYRLLWGSRCIRLPEPVWGEALSAAKHVWIVAEEGDVIRIAPDGTRMRFGRVPEGQIVGVGILDDDLWVAVGQGHIVFFGENTVGVQTEPGRETDKR